MLQHQHTITGGKRDRTSRAAFTDDNGHQRYRNLQTGFNGSGDCFGLASGFGVDSRESTGGIDETQNRQTESTRQLHQTARFAVAFRPRHTEVMRDATFSIRPFLGSKGNDGTPLKPAKTADHGRIIGECAIAGERRESGYQTVYIVGRLRPIRVPGNLGFLPGCQFCVGRPELSIGDGSQAGDLVRDIKAIGLRHSTEFLDLALQLGDQLFEVEEVAHGRGRVARFQPGESPPWPDAVGCEGIVDLDHDATRSPSLREAVAPIHGHGEPCVAILLSTFNGERYLGEQLHSYIAQTHDNWRLYWRDDGSSDDSTGLVAAFASGPGDGRCICLPKAGQLHPTASFLTLLRMALQGGASYFAFSDQDDVWLPEKLAHAVTGLGDVTDDRPALCFCARTLVDSTLRPIAQVRALRRPPGFPAALTQNVIPGCCMVLNRAAAELIDAMDAPDKTWHDWWCYLVVSAREGLVISGDAPDILYRQHPANVVGEARGFWRRAVRAIRRGREPFMTIFRCHVAALLARPGLLSDR